jgi:hypothetical protein
MSDVKMQLFALEGVPLLGQPATNGNAIERQRMRGIILWLLGVPLVVIILLYVFNIL